MCQNIETLILKSENVRNIFQFPFLHDENQNKKNMEL